MGLIYVPQNGKLVSHISRKLQELKTDLYSMIQAENGADQELTTLYLELEEFLMELENVVDYRRTHSYVEQD